jgi:group I intron endonuclease
MAEAVRSQSGIYAITNKVNGKQYIGSAVHIGKRWHRHKAQLRKNAHHSAKLQFAWNKYGQEAFELIIIETVADKSLLLTREQFWLDRYDVAGAAGYNILRCAGSMQGHKHTDEAKEKCRVAKLGAVFTDEHKAKLSAWQVGRKQSEETRAKRSAALKGRPRAPEVVAKMGGKRPPELVEKIRSLLIGKKRSPDVVAAMKLRRPSEEQRAKISATLKGRKVPPEVLEKRKATLEAKRLAKQLDRPPPQP